MGDYSVTSKFAQAVKAIKGLDGIVDDDAVLGAIDMYANAILTFVANTSSVREKTISQPVDGVDTHAPNEPESTGE